jgi:hypothetical protein
VCIFINSLLSFTALKGTQKTAAFIYLSPAEIAPPVADLFYFQQKASYSSGGGGKIIRPCKKERELRYFFVCELFPSFLQIGHLKNAVAS